MEWERTNNMICISCGQPTRLTSSGKYPERCWECKHPSKHSTILPVVTPSGTEARELLKKAKELYLDFDDRFQGRERTRFGSSPEARRV